MVSSDLLSILPIALGLSADCFAVAVGGAVSLKSPSPSQIWRTAFAFGLFQAGMPILGWRAGQTVAGLIAPYDHWVAFSLLAAVGGRMVWKSFTARDRPSQNIDISKGWLLLTLSAATSLDAGAVGLTFAFLEVNIVLASATIGVVALGVTATGFLLGRRAGKALGRGAETVGGIILIAIGLRILLTHIL